MEMENIVVTGGCGFIGSNFLNYMVKKYSNYRFINIDNLNYCSSINNVTVSGENNYRFIKSDINNEDFIKYIFQIYKPVIIFHFAAQSHVDNSFENPLQYINDNIRGTVVLLESVKKLSLDTVFIHISTDEVYGESVSEFKKENSELFPSNPYSATKAGAEMMLYSYGKSFNQKYKIVRGNNVYGKNQYKEKLIPKFIDFIKNNKKCTIHGNGDMKRSFVHVEDFCKAVESIWKNGKFSEIYNIGSEDEFSVLEITEKIINKIKGDVDPKNFLQFVKDRKFNDSRYLISSEKIKKIGWKREISFEEGINNLIGKKWLIYGGKGWIGSMFNSEINKEDYSVLGEERCENKTKLKEEILREKPDYIICCIGRTYGGKYNNIDYLEENPEINQRDNYDAPKNIFDICEELNIKCLYLGTGCIFEYDENHTIENKIGFTEEDSPNFFGSSYSRKKGELDLLTKKYKNVLNCRIRMPLTKKSNPRNFIDKIKSFKKICSIPNSMTFLDEAIPEMVRVLKLGKTGTINVVNPGTISHSEILDSLNCKYELISIEELEKSYVKARRSNNYLVTSDILSLTPVKDLKFN